MNRRTLLAFLVAPGVAPAVIALAGVHPNYAGAWVVALPVAAFTYGTAVLLGIPAYFLLAHCGWCAIWQFVLGGAVLGLFPALVFLLLAGSLQGALAAAEICVAIGGLSGLAFWGVAFAGKQVKRQPNPSFKRTPDGAA